ncbi:MAG: peptide deformylase [Sphingobacteriaceae bacterium]|nr:peptide deformylase [Sphingobacteriaceae bacterium]
MKTLCQNIFKEYREKIIDSSYHPTNPIETLKARLTATWLLQHHDPFIVKQAEAFIQKTSIFKETDLERLKQLSSQIKTWNEFQICSAYTNIAGVFLEYKISFTTVENRQQTLHFHAQYEIREEFCYFTSQTPPLIRVIGDPILHQPGVFFPETPTRQDLLELAKQIEQAKSILIQTGGAGIAANQCAGIDRPYCFTIVGVFYDIPEHVQGVEKRYPNTKFPQATIMVNPVITAVSQETQPFSHGCLSVPCANRCTVQSPKEISVTYQDPLDDMRIKQLTLTDVDAVVLWHELTHILFGKTYMDVTFETMPVQDLYQFQTMLRDELQNRQVECHDHLPYLTIPPFYLSVKINEAGIPRLDRKELANVLPHMTEETLAGLLNQAQQLLKKKQDITDESLKGLLQLSFYSTENRQHQFIADPNSGFIRSKL